MKLNTKYLILNTKRIFFLTSALLVAGLGIFIYSFFFSKEAGAAWFDELWLYRTPLTITHNAEVLNNKVKFDIDTATLITAGKMQGDCGDTRFTDTSGKLLKYYLDSANGACNTDSTDYYVLVPKVINGTTVTYHYYGNPSAPNGSEPAQLSEATLTPSGSYAAGSETQGPGPVGYWAFDDGQGTTAQDSSSSNNDGSITGATWQTEDRCISGKCLYFDGTDDLVSVTDPAKADFGTGDFTASVWVRYTKVGQNRGILIKDNWAGDGNGIYIYAAEDTSGGIFGYWNGSSTISIGTIDSNWDLLTVKRSGTTITTYKNGVQVATGTDSRTLSNAIDLTFGRANDLRYMNGFMDDVKLYPYARTAAQIKTDYNAGKGSAGTNSGAGAVLGAQPQDWLSNGLVGYWKMDDAGIDAEGETSTDSSGNSNTGTLYGDNGVGDNGTGMNCTASGKFGSGCNFDGVDDYISLDPSTAFDVGSTGDFSASLWVKSSATNDNHLLRAQSDNDNYWSLYHEGSDDLMRFRIQNGSGNSDILAATTTVENGNWHFVTIVRKNSGTRMEIYIDGALNNSSTSTARSPGTIGQFRIAEGAGNYIDATIDEVRVYNRALTSAEISSLYNWAPGPVGYWDFEEGGNIGIGSTAFDRSTSANPGIWKGSGPQRTAPGKFGKAGKFDGSSDYIRVNSSSNWDYGANNFSIDFWIKPDTSQNGPVMGRRWTNRSWMLYLQDGILYLTASTDGSGWTTAFDSSSDLGLTVVNNTWQHVAFTRNGSNWYAYLNGSQQDTVSSSITIYSSSEPLHIGADDEAGTWYYSKGLLDEIKIYKYARTQKQIVSDMNAGHPNVGSPVGSAIGHWKFDEGQGTVANNSGSGGPTLNGTLTSMASPATATSGWTQAGKFNKGLIFDGSDDYVALGSTSALQNSEFTISVWIKPTTVSVRQTIFDNGGVNNSTTRVAIETTGKIRFFLTNVRQLCASNTGLTANAWTHVVVTYNSSSGACTVYLNGISNGSATDAATMTYTSPQFLIGNEGSTGSLTEPFSGSIDEVKVYNYALTADEVKTDYNKGSSLVLGTAGDNSTYAAGAANQEYCVPGDTTSCAAPVARWDFEEGNGGTVNDTSGNGNTGTWNGTGSHWTNGKIGKAGNFNGSDDYVDIGDKSVLEFGTGNFTVSAWFKSSSSDNRMGLLGTYNSGNSDDFFILRDGGGGTSGEVSFMVAGDGTWGSSATSDSTTYNDGKWHYAVGVRESSVLKLYLDGILQSTQPANTVNIDSSQKSLRIAAEGPIGEYFDGTIDQVRIYNYARSPAQIAWDYNRGAPVGWWKFDDCQGTVAHDSTLNANHGTITIGATGEDTLGTCTTSSTAWGSGATGKRNASLSLDGTDDYVDIGNQTPFQFGTGDFSASFWMKANAWSGYTAPLSNSVYTSSWDGFHFEEESGGGGCTTGGIRFEFPDNTRACWNSVINTGTWYHVVGVRRSGTATIYVNGVAGGSSSATTANVNVARDFLIGRNPDITYPRYFNGQIDDVKVFNYALTSTQVKNEYNNGAVFFGPTSGSP